MNKKLLTVLLALVLLFATAGGAMAEGAQDSSQTWDVSVGKGMVGVSLDSMFPKVIYVNEGDTVKFTNGALITPHTVTFLQGAAPLNPSDPASLAPTAPSGIKWDGKALLSSGILEPGKDYSVTFTATGAYSYYCVLHPLMTGTIVVLPKGTAVPSKTQQLAWAKAQADDLIEQAAALEAAQHEVKYVKNANGTLTYKMALGVGHRSFTVNKMFPETLLISEGDTVEWMNDNHYEPHWVTFNKPADLSFFGPHGEFNPKFMAPAGGATFNGQGFVNSGMLMAHQSYKLTFTKAGTYTYECYLHSGDLMKGKIVVAPKNTVKIVANGKPITTSNTLTSLQNNHLYVAVDAYAKVLGGTVVWNKKLGALVVTIGKAQALPTKLDKTAGVKVIVNGKQLKTGLAVAPYSRNGHTYVALEEVVSLLGGSYSWNAATKTFSFKLGQ